MSLPPHLTCRFASYPQARIAAWRSHSHLHAANRSPKTIRTDTDAVRQLVAYCAEHDRPTDPVDMRREDVEGFISQRLDTLYSSTAATRYRGLQQWFRWLEDEEEIDRSPMARMKPPSVDKKQVQVADTDDLRTLLKVCKGTGFSERRTRRSSCSWSTPALDARKPLAYAWST